MDLNKPQPYGKSSSMPLLPRYTEGDAEQDYAIELSWEEVLEDVKRSPGYKLLFSGGSAPMFPRRDADGSPMSCPYATEKGGDTSISSPRSDSTVKPEDILESGGVTLTPIRQSSGGRESSTAKSPGPGIIGDRSLAHVLATQLSPQAPVFQPTVPLGNTVPPERTDTPYEELVTNRATDSDRQSPAKEHGLTPDPFISPKACGFGGFGSFNMGSPVKNKNAASTLGMDRFGGLSTARGVAQGTPNSRGTTHHRRLSSRFSFVPVQPSPLGPGCLTDDLGSDVSGLVSPAPMTGPLTQMQSSPWNSAPAPKAATLQKPPVVPFSWTQSTPGSYSPFDMSPVNDPFLEYHPSTEIPTSGYTPHRRRAPTPTTPQRRKSSQDELCHPVTGLSIYDVEQIPPPSLPIGQSLRKPDPEARARLDVQKSRRQKWIETKAHELVTIARTAALLKQQYQLTQRAEDYEAWNRAQSDFHKAWSVKRLTEERRNLTLPEDMRAMRTGPGNLPEDGMGGKEGRLLGHKMAIMERICAEIVIKEDECKMAAEHLNEFSKKAVRKAVMSDVQAGTGKRRGRQVQRGRGGEPAQHGNGTHPVEHQP